jgi:hypothetical protein
MSVRPSPPPAVIINDYEGADPAPFDASLIRVLDGKLLSSGFLTTVDHAVGDSRLKVLPVIRFD